MKCDRKISSSISSWVRCGMAAVWVAAAILFLTACAVTQKVTRTEKTEEVPAVQSGPVEWNDDLIIVDLGIEASKDGEADFEVKAEGPDSSQVTPAKVKLHYTIKYKPVSKKIEMSIDSAKVETKKEIKTITVSTEKTIEKKFYRNLFLIIAGAAAALALVVFLIIKRFTR